MPAAFEYHAKGRNLRTLTALALAWALLAMGWWILAIAPWIMALLILPTLPAAWDVWANPSAGLRLDDTVLQWHSGRRSVEIRLDEIDCIRLDRRFDFSIRASVVPHTGRRIRLPVESSPPADLFESALTARGVRIERHPFSVF